MFVRWPTALDEVQQGVEGLLMLLGEELQRGNLGLGLTELTGELLLFGLGDVRRHRPVEGLLRPFESIPFDRLDTLLPSLRFLRHGAGDSPTGSAGIVDVNVVATATGLGDGAPCAYSACVLRFEGGMPDTNNVIRRTSLPFPGAAEFVLSGQTEASIAASGDNHSVPDQLYMRAALYGVDSSGSQILLADSPWTVASSFAVQGKTNVEAIAGSLAVIALLGGNMHDLCVEAFPEGSRINGTSLTDLQVACLELQNRAPAATPVRAVADLGGVPIWLPIIGLAVAVLAATVGIPLLHQGEPPTGDPIEDPELLNRINDFLGRRPVESNSPDYYLQVSDSQRRAVAQMVVTQCQSLATAQAFSETECWDLPIFMPGSDAFFASAHDAAAIASGKPALIHYTPDGAASGGWYYNMAAAKPNNCSIASAAEKAGRECDEYPFRSAQEGGPGNDPPLTNASLRLVNRGDNGREGTSLGIFLKSCGIYDQGNGAPYLVIPIVPPVLDSTETATRSGPPTMAVCAPGF